MSQAGKLYSGATGNSALATTIIADVGQAQGKNNILNALGSTNINTAAFDAHTVQINLNNTVMIDEATIGNINITDNTISSVNTNGHILIIPNSGHSAQYDNDEINPSSFLYFGNSSRMYSTASATDGQVLIGSDSGIPSAANLTAGDNITINNAANNVTISSTTAGSGWMKQWIVIKSTDYLPGQSYTYQMQPNVGYIVYWYTAGVSSNPTILNLTLPPASSLNIGDFFSVVCMGGYAHDNTIWPTSYIDNFYINQAAGGYAFIAPYQPVQIVTSRIRPITATSGPGGYARPAISFVYAGTDVNMTGGNQPILQVIHSMGVWKY